VLHSFIRNFPLFCHNVWNETSSHLRHFSQIIFLHPLENSPVDSLSSPFFVCLKPPPTLTDPPDCDFQTLLCCLSVRSFFPPAPVWKRSARCLRSLCDGRQSKRREEEMRGGRQCLSCVCGAWGTYSACSWRVENEGLIYWFVFPPSGVQPLLTCTAHVELYVFIWAVSFCLWQCF